MDNLETDPKVFFTRELLASNAFKSLKHHELRCLFDFYEKRKMASTGRRSGNGRSSSGKKWVIANNGEIQFPYSEAEALGYSRKQFRDALDGLQLKGFIDITHLGKGGRKPAKGQGDASKYLIDDRWREFENGRAVKPPKKPRTPDTRQDRGWSLFWQNVRNVSILLYILERTKQVQATIGEELKATGLKLDCAVEQIQRKNGRLEKQT